MLCLYFWNTPKLCVHLGFPLKTYTITKIYKECILVCDAAEKQVLIPNSECFISYSYMQIVWVPSIP